jgi:7-carboxy-7-deazaguanine synthase
VSPKAGSEVVQRIGQELKVVYPQPGAEPERFADWEFRHRYIQPRDGPDREENTRRAIDYCMENPRWRLGVQMHKVVGLR